MPITTFANVFNARILSLLRAFLSFLVRILSLYLTVLLPVFSASFSEFLSLTTVERLVSNSTSSSASPRVSAHSQRNESGSLLLDTPRHKLWQLDILTRGHWWQCLSQVLKQTKRHLFLKIKIAEKLFLPSVRFELTTSGIRDQRRYH